VLDGVHTADTGTVGAGLLGSEAVAVQLEALALLAVTVFPAVWWEL